MSRSKVVIALLVIMVLIATGCNTANPAPSQSTGSNQQPEKKTSAIIALWAEPTSICSGFNSKSYNNVVSHEMLESLIEHHDDGTFTPLLATSWEFVNNNKDIQFKLRENVYFSNGEKMTVDDVVFSYNTIIDTGFVDNLCGAMDHMEKIDENTVLLVFEAPYGPALLSVASSAMCIFPQAYYEANKDTFIRQPVGTGPYKLVEWKTGDYVALTANEHYWGDAPAIKDITYKFFYDTNAATIALESGEIDVLLTVPTSDKQRLINDSNIQLNSSESLTRTWVFFNHEGIFADENVRLAVAYGINKGDVLLGAVEGDGILLESISPSMLAGVDPNYKAPGNNQDKARELLAQAGYPDGFDVTIKTPSEANFLRPLEIVQGQLSEIGINITIEKVELGAWYADVFEAGDYVMGVQYDTMAIADMDDLRVLYRSGQFLNTGFVEYPELDEYFDAYRWTAAGPERTQIGYNLNRFMGDHAIVVPMYGVNNHIAANADMKGIEARVSKGDYTAKYWSW